MIHISTINDELKHVIEGVFGILQTYTKDLLGIEDVSKKKKDKHDDREDKTTDIEL